MASMDIAGPGRCGCNMYWMTVLAHDCDGGGDEAAINCVDDGMVELNDIILLVTCYVINNIARQSLHMFAQNGISLMFRFSFPLFPLL